MKQVYLEVQAPTNPYEEKVNKHNFLNQKNIGYDSLFLVFQTKQEEKRQKIW